MSFFQSGRVEVSQIFKREEHIRVALQTRRSPATNGVITQSSTAILRVAAATSFNPVVGKVNRTSPASKAQLTTCECSPAALKGCAFHAPLNSSVENLSPHSCIKALLVCKAFVAPSSKTTRCMLVVSTRNPRVCLHVVKRVVCYFVSTLHRLPGNCVNGIVLSNRTSTISRRVLTSPSNSCSCVSNLVCTCKGVSYFFSCEET